MLINTLINLTFCNINAIIHFSNKFMFGSILIAFSAIISILSFLGLVNKKEKLDKDRFEAVKKEKKKAELLRNASKFGAAAGAAGIAAGAYYINKNPKQSKNFLNTPKKLSKIKSPIFRKKRKKKWKLF